MKAHHISVMLTVGFFIGYTWNNMQCIGEDMKEEPVREIKELSDKFHFSPAEANSKLPYFVVEGASWPDEKTIQEKKVEITLPEVKSSITSTVYWLKNIIKKEWLPEDIEQRLLPLQESLEGEDAIWVRYQSKGYAIQIVINFGLLKFFVSTIDKKNIIPVENKKEAEDAIVKVVDTFLNKSDLVRKKLPEVKIIQGIASGIPTQTSDRAPNLWWEQVRWWSDGKTIALWIPKTDERTAALMPIRKKHWFSKPLEKR